MKLTKRTLTSSMQQRKNQNTERKTELNVNLMYSNIASEAGGHVNKPPKIEELSRTKLYPCLSKFLLAVRKKTEKNTSQLLFEVFCSQSNVA